MKLRWRDAAKKGVTTFIWRKFLSVLDLYPQHDQVKTHKKEQQTFPQGRLVPYMCIKYVTAFHFWEAFF